MRNSNALQDQNTKTGYKIYSLSFIFFLLLSFPQNGISQQLISKNAIVLAPQFGRHTMGMKLQYQRSLTKNFALVGTVGTQKWKKDLTQFNKGKLQVSSQSFGIGGQWQFDGEPSGLFVQGNILLRSTQTHASAKIPRSSESGTWGLFEDPWTDLFFGILTSLPNNINVDYHNKDTEVGVNAKLGYSFISNSQKMTLTPFIAFETTPGDNSSVNIAEGYGGNMPINTKQEFQKSNFNFGFEMGFRF